MARSVAPVEPSVYVPISGLTAEGSDDDRTNFVVVPLSPTVPDLTLLVAHSLAPMAEYLIEELLILIFGILITADTSHLRILNQVCQCWRDIHQSFVESLTKHYKCLSEIKLP